MQLGVWKSSLSDVIHKHGLVLNGPPKSIACPLTDPKGGSVNKDLKVVMEISLTGLGLPEENSEAMRGSKLADLGDDIKKKRGVLHVQLKDCHNLHDKMNPALGKKLFEQLRKLAKSEYPKLEPYVKFYVGTKRDFQRYFGKDGSLEAGVLAKPYQEREALLALSTKQSKSISPGQEVVWNERDGKFVFDMDNAAVDLCVLAQVYHENTMLGQTFIEVQNMIFDSKTNRFSLKEEDMVRVLSNEDYLVVPNNGSPSKKDYWEAKSFEELMNLEIPLITIFVSFVPKTYSIPGIKVVVKRAAKLPKMDRFTGRADPFVIVSLGKEGQESLDAVNLKQFQTDVVYKTLEPCWQQNNVFTLNLDPDAWKEENLRLIVMDYEKLGASREMGSWKANVVDLFRKKVKDLNATADNVSKDNDVAKWEGIQDLVVNLETADGKSAGELFCGIAFIGDVWASVSKF